MKKLTWPQRIVIAKGIRAGKSNAQIAREIGVHRSTVGREIERNAESRESYQALEADDRSWYRQQEAVPKRMMLFGGVEFFQVLQKHNALYIYFSHTHLNKLFRYLNTLQHWDPCYIRKWERKRFMPESAFFRQPRRKGYWFSKESYKKYLKEKQKAEAAAHPKRKTDSGKNEIPATKTLSGKKTYSDKITNCPSFRRSLSHRFAPKTALGRNGYADQVKIMAPNDRKRKIPA
jgi:hypothetical protein